MEQQREYNMLKHLKMCLVSAQTHPRARDSRTFTCRYTVCAACYIINRLTRTRKNSLAPTIELIDDDYYVTNKHCGLWYLCRSSLSMKSQ